MQKKFITLGVVFCIFILCSLTYQPIIANQSIDNTLGEKTLSNNNQLRKIDINSIIKLLLRSKILGNNCGCDEESKGLWPFPIICGILYILSEISLRFGVSIAGPPFLHMITSIIAMVFGCNWVYPK